TSPIQRQKENGDIYLGKSPAKIFTELSERDFSIRVRICQTLLNHLTGRVLVTFLVSDTNNIVCLYQKIFLRGKPVTPSFLFFQIFKFDDQFKQGYGALSQALSIEPSLDLPFQPFDGPEAV